MFFIDATEPEIRGPYFWDVINLLGLSYYPTMKDNYQKFFDSLSDILPCGECRVNYKKFLEKHPIDLSSQEALLIWILKLHNSVNIRNDKEDWDVDKFLDYLHERYADKKKSDG